MFNILADVIQVKIFLNENDVNKWFKESKNREIVDIQFTSDSSNTKILVVYKT
ncbi:hypothetical protein ABES80_14625 [Bacillus gobiensis]|uniref:hypothetical protein n=1 Tax=Bacillus gobiensis TaxID=1441095 RepID=UPI003D209806